MNKKIVEVGAIPTSLGEIINFKYHLDTIKDGYDEIHLCFATGLWDDALHTDAPDWPQKKQLWQKFLSDIGYLFFNEPPYILIPHTTKWAGSIDAFTTSHNVTPQKPEMSHLLCDGAPLNIGEYIVVTTKIRNINKHFLLPLLDQFLKVLLELSNKYKIVILGERQVEMRREYDNYHTEIFGIYHQLIDKIPTDRVLDLTVPALGETVSDLIKIRQDCLIMNQAKFVVTFGVGGNFCLSTSVANMAIGFRNDQIAFGDYIWEQKYPNAIITKSWVHFIETLRSYL